MEKTEFHYNMTRLSGNLHDDLCTFMIISYWNLLRIKNVSDKSCTENQNTHFMFSNFCSQQMCFLWDNVKQYNRGRQATDGNMIRHEKMWSACQITMARIQTTIIFYTYCFITD